MERDLTVAFCTRATLERIVQANWRTGRSGSVDDQGPSGENFVKHVDAGVIERSGGGEHENCSTTGTSDPFTWTPCASRPYARSKQFQPASLYAMLLHDFDPFLFHFLLLGALLFV